MTDDNATVERLSRTKLYEALKSRLSDQGDAVESATLNLLHSAAGYCQNRLKTVIRYMPEFTLHDDVHVFNVLNLMDKLLPENTKNNLSVPELLLLILSAFFHDVGMAPEEAQLRSWKKAWQSNPTDEEKQEYERYERFRRAYPSKIIEIQRLWDAKENQRAQILEESLISEYIRESHAERTRQYIAKDWKGRITYKDTDLTNELAELCLSHNENAIRLLDMIPAILCDENEYVCMPFLGVILRLADLLDFDPKRTPSVLFSHLSIRNAVSISEWKKHRSITAWQISTTKIVYSARCKHPAIETSIRRFCDLIDVELRDCSHVLTHISDALIEPVIKLYRIPLPPSVDRSKIMPERDISTGKPLYVYRDTQFTLSKTQVIDLLMGTKLYGNTNVALRELIQNSIDACSVRIHMEGSWKTDYKPKILVKYYTDRGEDFLVVEDNGIGMNQHVIDSYYSKIGSSYYKSKEFYELFATIGGRYEPISRFGIGILSCFMVSDSIDVQTRMLTPDQERDDPISIQIEGYDSIFHIRQGERKQPGTFTKLRLRSENPWKIMSQENFISAVRESVPNPPFELLIETDKSCVTHSNSYFTDLDPTALRKNDWNNDDNIRELRIEIDEPDFGFSGRAIVGVLEQDDEPVEKIEVLSKSAEIEGEIFELSLSLNYDTNEIEKRTTSIDVADDGSIEQASHYSVMARSRSAFSIHGISFPEGLFRGLFSRRRGAKIDWPFPVLLVLDVRAPTTIDLNTSRTEIVNNTKWQCFEVKLAYTITKQIFSLVEEMYAKELIKIYSTFENPFFKEGILKAKTELNL